MPNDPENTGGKTTPAQIPVVPAARQVNLPIPPAFAPAPKIGGATTDAEVVVALDATTRQVKHTGVIDLVAASASIAGGPSSPAAATPAGATVIPPVAVPVPVAYPNPAIVPQGAALPRGVPASIPGHSEIASDEERTLFYVLRLMDRVIGPGTLSPVERAFVSGARVMFGQLADECERMLKRNTPVALDSVDTAPAKTAPKRSVAKKQAKATRAKK